MKANFTSGLLATIAMFGVVIAPSAVLAEEGTSIPIGLSDSETSYKGARVLKHNVEVFGGKAEGGYYADTEDPGLVSRYSNWQGDTLFFGSVNNETGNTVDGVAEFYWFESSVPKSSDFYVVVVKVKNSPNVVDDWQLTQEDNWLGELMYDIEPCQRLEFLMAPEGKGGSLRWDWSVPFQNYQWEPVKTVEISQGYSAGFDSSISGEGDANIKKEFKEGGFLADASAGANIQAKGFFNSEYSVKSKYSVTLYKWQMLVQGGAENMKWHMAVLKDGTLNNDSAYHEYFVVIQAPQGETVKVNKIDIGGYFREINDFWFDGWDALSVAVTGIEFVPPVEIECYENDVPPYSVCQQVGVCSQGQTVCKNGKWECSLPEIYEKKESLCDGLDNDCDGKLDEQLYDYCGTVCGEGMKACINGEWGPCDKAPVEEVCDNLDNNCNGNVDENLAQPCQTACGIGQQLCKNGLWGACSSDPVDEICDGKDNDCNGEIDDGIIRKCDTACGEGAETCVNGAWTQCSALPELELCDGVDNDCDGQVDEGLTRACATDCGTGIEECVAGVWNMCSARLPAPEICADNFDNDCNGAIDDPGTCIDPNTGSPPGSGMPSVGGDTAEAEGGCATGVNAGLNGWGLGFLLGLIYMWLAFRREYDC
jgi:hypothetical protein